MGWISGITLVIGTGMAVWIQFNPSELEQLQGEAKHSLLRSYNNISHGMWMAIFLTLTGILTQSIYSCSPSANESKTSTSRPWIRRLATTIKPTQ